MFPRDNVFTLAVGQKYVRSKKRHFQLLSSSSSPPTVQTFSYLNAASLGPKFRVYIILGAELPSIPSNTNFDSCTIEKTEILDRHERENDFILSVTFGKYAIIRENSE